MAKKAFKYNEGLEELQQIVQEIEENEISVDELAKKVKRASDLLKLCKDMLEKTEEEVNTILNKSEDE
ncbi:MAG: exodeoxyribonuclease VII small subunit [Flavobacteriales bacterium]